MIKKLCYKLVPQDMKSQYDDLVYEVGKKVTAICKILDAL